MLGAKKLSFLLLQITKWFDLRAFFLFFFWLFVIVSLILPCHENRTNSIDESLNVDWSEQISLRIPRSLKSQIFKLNREISTVRKSHPPYRSLWYLCWPSSLNSYTRIANRFFVSRYLNTIYTALRYCIRVTVQCIVWLEWTKKIIVSCCVVNK